MFIFYWPSDKSVCLWNRRLGFDSKSGQTNNFKIGITTFLLDAGLQPGGGVEGLCHRAKFCSPREIQLFIRAYSGVHLVANSAKIGKYLPNA